jgi:hypothetical protein
MKLEIDAVPPESRFIQPSNGMQSSPLHTEEKELRGSPEKCDFINEICIVVPQ